MQNLPNSEWKGIEIMSHDLGEEIKQKFSQIKRSQYSRIVVLLDFEDGNRTINNILQILQKVFDYCTTLHHLVGHGSK